MDASGEHGSGVVLDFADSVAAISTPIDDPLQLVLPDSADPAEGKSIWKCKADNGIEVTMHDIRHVHKLQEYHGCYALEFRRPKSLWPKKPRQPFNDQGFLRCFCEFAAQGTIIHPSVYQMLDELCVTSLVAREWSLREQIEGWKKHMHEDSQESFAFGFWNKGGEVDVDELSAIRILVCGNTGVDQVHLDKPGLRHRSKTKSSDRSRGIHHIDTPITNETRPNLIIHDSGGFEAGDISQLQAVEKFVRQKAGQTKLEDRLHVIWFCIEMSSVRTTQTATNELFQAVSKFSSEIPLIVIATKKDELFATKWQEARGKYKNAPDLMATCDKYADDEVMLRLSVIEDEMEQVRHGRLDACVAVSKDDRKSIDELNATTVESFSHEKLRLVYIAAQFASIDLKVDLAIIETMRIYRRVLGTSAGLSMIPSASMTNRTAAILAVGGAIMKCFGLPGIKTQTLFEIVKFTMWDNIGHDAMLAFSEAVAGAGGFMTVATAGIPFFLVAGAVNPPLVIPAVSRSILIFSADLVLVLSHALGKIMLTCTDLPSEKDIAKAAEEFRPHCAKIHDEVLALVPRSNFIKCLQYNRVRRGLEHVVEKYRHMATDSTGKITVHPHEDDLPPRYEEDGRPNTA